MPWRSLSNKNDCGVFLMRHMQTYEAEDAEKWECGLEKDNVSILFFQYEFI